MCKRLIFLKRAVMLALGFLTLNAFVTAEPSHQPNFIQILTDDQGWGDLGSFGHLFIKSPNIDKLADEGIKFTHCYSANSVCSPSRAAILTGRTPFRNGVYRWIPPEHFCHLPKDEITLPQLLRDNGYQTAHFGKWHLGYYSEERIPDTEDFKNFKLGGEIVGQPTMSDYGYDYWFATGNVARPDHKNPLNFFLNGKAMGEMEGFSAQIVANEFVMWMEKHRNADEPFFVTVWFLEPHGPIHSDPRFVEKYKHLDDPSLRQYLANITQIDEAVGSMVKALKDAGVYENTIIWYTSDNGPEGAREPEGLHGLGTYNMSDSAYGNSRSRGSTGGLRGRKRATHEGGIRVPGIISWPKGLKDAGVQPGSISSEPIIGSDIFLTMLDAAGVQAPTDRIFDGASILPVIEGRPFSRPRPLYWRNMYYEDRVALRDGNWKILSNSYRTEFVLYNLEMDPRETTDLSKHYPEVFARMKAQLIAYDKEVIEEGPKWWQEDQGRLKQSIPLN